MTAAQCKKNTLICKVYYIDNTGKARNHSITIEGVFLASIIRNEISLYNLLQKFDNVFFFNLIRMGYQIISTIFEEILGVNDSLLVYINKQRILSLNEALEYAPKNMIINN